MRFARRAPAWLPAPVSATVHTALNPVETPAVFRAVSPMDSATMKLPAVRRSGHDADTLGADGINVATLTNRYWVARLARRGVR